MSIMKNKTVRTDVKIPNKETLKNFKKTDKGKNLVHYKNPKEMFDKLGM